MGATDCARVSARSRSPAQTLALFCFAAYESVCSCLPPEVFVSRIQPAAFASVEALVASQTAESVHIECGRALAARALAAVRETFGARRCAYYLEGDAGYERETVASYLRFFARLAGGGASASTAIDHFGLRERARTRVGKLNACELALLNFARCSLFEPEVCFFERPLANLDAEARRLVLLWMVAEQERGTVFITAGQTLREALLMPGHAWWVDDDDQVFPVQEVDAGAGSGDVDRAGSVCAAQRASADSIESSGDAAGGCGRTGGPDSDSDGSGRAGGSAFASDASGRSGNLGSASDIDGSGSASGGTSEVDDEPFFPGDEVQVVKIACKSDGTTLLFDPREVDFIESANRVNYASVRGQLYATSLTMDELDRQLERYGFFRCHRSFIVNVQRIRAVERYTRNSFNLSLSDVAGSSVPLSKGRAEALRERLGM